ncbi:MAG: ATP synthase F1 subunit epsilon [Planctomycetes bacterium]|nr:ATP synthase F1 subunit epsilon [Planctomycetota bacterium]
MVKTQLEDGVDVTSPIDVLEVTVVTPEATVLKSPAQFVALPLYDGEIGIAPGRAPLIGRLGFGEMRLKSGDKTLIYYLDGGFVEVSNNYVTVLTNRAIPADKIDRAVVEERLAAAQKKPASTPELLEIRDRAVAAARGQLWVARKK